ncbi:type IV pilus modification PilV family protein [Desulfofundulus australicus]|uniref:type IV pilus modification PilV family protein n=1 Tax=Desulfofundulus australicus TaxID=1566 RepID=UPI0009321B14|nr:type II secretion system protein [Desulfofundulus australicus]
MHIERCRQKLKKQISYPVSKKLMNNSGLILLEIMLGVIILSIAMIPLIGLTITHYKEVWESRRKSTALYLAQQKLEEYKSGKKIESEEINRKIPFTDPDFADYKYKVCPLGGNTYKIEIYYHDNEQPLANLTGEIITP